MAPVFVLTALNTPLVGPLTITKVNGLPSTSDPLRTRFVAVSSGVVTFWPLATGAVFVATTLRLALTTAELAWPSLAR